MMIKTIAAQNWFTYIVKCSDDSYYTGITTDLKTRLQKHNQGKGAAYTRGRGPVSLLHQERFADRSSASKRESEIKKLTRPQKEELITTSPADTLR